MPPAPPARGSVCAGARGGAASVFSNQISPSATPKALAYPPGVVRSAGTAETADDLEAERAQRVSSILLNRAPVLTLWATVVAERLGHPPGTALTLGRAVAGSAARVKARNIGREERTADRDAETPQLAEIHVTAPAFLLDPAAARR